VKEMEIWQRNFHVSWCQKCKKEETIPFLDSLELSLSLITLF